MTRITSSSPATTFPTRRAALESAKSAATPALIARTEAGWEVTPVSADRVFESALTSAQRRETWALDATGTLLVARTGKTLEPVSEQDFFVEGPSRVSRPPLPRVEPGPQVNHGRNVHWQPRFAFQPGRDIEQLVDVMRWVADSLPPSVKVRASGSRHSWSAAAATDGVAVLPQGMAFVEPLEGKPGLFRVGSGTRIRELNQQLWERGRSLPVLGGFDGQTVGGVLPTGTHGSVLSAGPLADRLVRSIDLVTPGGEKVRLEPRGGLTDAAEFARTNPGWRLVQEDAAFDAALINVGSFGVVHSYVLDTVPRFFLKEVRTRTTGAELERTLANGNLRRLAQTDDTRPPDRALDGHPPHAYHLEFLWNPLTDSAVVTSRQPVPDADAAQLVGTSADDARPGRELLRSLRVPREHSRWAFGEIVFQHLHALTAKLSDLAMEWAPSLTPKLIDGMLDAMPDTNGYVGRSYNVFNIGDGANQLPAQSATLSVPLEGDQYLEAMAIVRRVAQEFAAKEQYQSGPISMRFVKGSRASLGDPVDVCKFELIFSGNDADDQRLAQTLTNAYDAALRARFGDAVRVHLGQLQPQRGDSAARLQGGHPGYANFVEQQRRFDPQGRMVTPFLAERLPR